MKRERRVRAPGRAIGHVMILVPTDGQVAQLVEHVTENHGVGGSIPSLATSYKANKINDLRLLCGRMNWAGFCNCVSQV